MIAAGADDSVPLAWRWLGRRPYREISEEQERVRDCVLAGEQGAQCILLGEHPEVITVGRGGGREDLLESEVSLRARGVPVIASNRGGRMTYHGPGQLVVYPIVRIESVVAHLTWIAGALAAVLARRGIGSARWCRQRPGLWVDSRKIASCGIHLRRSVAIHGFALNVSVPIERWRALVPCGLEGVKMTSMHLECGSSAESASVESVAAEVAAELIGTHAAGARR